jgi:hypothetical protein
MLSRIHSPLIFGLTPTSVLVLWGLCTDHQPQFSQMHLKGSCVGQDSRWNTGAVDAFPFWSLSHFPMVSPWHPRNALSIYCNREWLWSGSINSFPSTLSWVSCVVFHIGIRHPPDTTLRGLSAFANEGKPLVLGAGGIESDTHHGEWKYLKITLPA